MKPYHIRFISGPLFGQVLLVHAEDALDAAAQVGKALGKHALDTGHAVYRAPGTPDLFGAAPQVETLTLDEALEALQHGQDAS